MASLTFFSVLKSNLKCAVCKKKKCPVRYMPNRKHIEVHSGTAYAITCEKDQKKREDDFFKKLSR